MLEPVYSKRVVLVLDEIEADPGRRALWNAICDAIDLVCDHPESADARHDRWSVPSGATVWQVPIRCAVEDDNWVLIWQPDGGDAIIHYVGPRGSVY